MVADIQERMKKKEDMEKQNKILKLKIREENRKKAEEKLTTIRSREGTVEQQRIEQEAQIKKKQEQKYTNFALFFLNLTSFFPENLNYSRSVNKDSSKYRNSISVCKRKSSELIMLEINTEKFDILLRQCQ